MRINKSRDENLHHHNHRNVQIQKGIPVKGSLLPLEPFVLKQQLVISCRRTSPHDGKLNMGD